MVGKTDGEGSRVPLEQLSAELRRASVATTFKRLHNYVSQVFQVTGQFVER